MSKISIRIEPIFFLLALALGWMSSGSLIGTALFAVVVFFSILFHELGHALTALSFGQSSSITLMALGGVTKRMGGALSPWKEFMIVLNGPLAGFFLYFMCAWALQKKGVHDIEIASYMLQVGAFINLFWTLLNLAPVVPLDGGRLLMIVLQRLFGIRGIQICYAIGLLVAIVLGVVFIFINQILAAAFFFIFAFESYRLFRSSRLMSPADASQEMKGALNLAIHQNSKDKLEEIRKKAKSGWIYLSATFHLAKILQTEGENQVAYHLLISEKGKWDREGDMLLQNLEFATGHFAEGAKTGEELFREQADPQVAFINALCFANLKKQEPCLGWLKTAIREGYDSKAALHDPAFEFLHPLPEYQLITGSTTLN
jgi:stage IV sporulation protein FB